MGIISSTALLTAESLLSRFGIKLSHKSLTTALSDHGSIYSQLLRVPIKNIFNGIVFQQAYDYQVYLQKLFIDYHLSPEYAKPQDAPGASRRQDLEGWYEECLRRMQALSEVQFQHYQLISESQAWLIGVTKNLKNLTNELSQLL